MMPDGSSSAAPVMRPGPSALATRLRSPGCDGLVMPGRALHAPASCCCAEEVYKPPSGSSFAIGPADRRPAVLLAANASRSKGQAIRLVGWLALILLAQGSFRLLAAGAFGDRQIRFYSHKEADNPVCLPAAGLRPILN